MDYRDALSYIESKNSLGIMPGLDVILELLSGLGHPEGAVPALHIAGTNGKGTIMSYVEHAMLQAGMRVGRYLSPAVLDYREKWHINGEMVSEEDIVSCMEEIRAVAETMPQSPTSFEIETALAFLLFRRKNCDIMLVECGMGGRLDATNVIPLKVLDILASVSMDHMQFLGDTREKILNEKLGIVKPGDVLVTAPMDEELRNVVRTYPFPTMGEEGIVFTPTEEVSVQREDIHGTDFIFRNETYHIRMPGDVALENAITALMALEVYNKRAGQFGLPQLTQEQIREGLAAADWQGRFTVFDTHPMMIVDGAHNRDAWLRLAETIRRFFRDRKITFVLGVLADKEVDTMIDALVPLAKRIHVFTPESPRALAGEKLKSRILAYCAEPDFVSCEDSALSAAEKALRESSEEDVIVACGSLTFLGGLIKARGALEMDRVTRILNDAFYKKQIKKIYESEYDREYCRHGFGHAISVARIAYILALENRCTVRKDVVYAASLLHDIGRYTPEEKELGHHAAGAGVAEDVLIRAGYTEAERKVICEAIRAHKNPQEDSALLAGILYRADKLSRNCFLCDARESCYWPEERKNRSILC